MATRGSITYVNENGSFVQIYTHWDSYPSHNGILIGNFLKTQEDVEKLVSGGDISSMSVKDGELVVEYYKDRGDSWDLVKPQIDLRHERHQECNYLFKDGEWLYAIEDGKTVKLIDVLRASMSNSMSEDVQKIALDMLA